MRLVFKLTFAALLCLSNISQIVGLPGFYQMDDDGIHDDLITSERQITEENNNEWEKGLAELRKRLAEFMRHLQKDDQLIPFGIVQLTYLDGIYSCRESRQGLGVIDKDHYNILIGLYPTMQYKYNQLLEKLDQADEIMLKKFVHTAKTTALEWCKMRYGTK